ncbi:MAG: Uncharacterised protein [Prochlorococcus marinus str. MIT 9215]|nr:MAG: Uncharacterised protein [Prochlorococcus marinus str. MIT 9215]
MNQFHVQVPSLIERLGNRLFGDLVEHHPLNRNFGVQQLKKVPTDAFSLPVFVSRQQELIRTLKSVFEFTNSLFLVLRNDVKGFKVDFCIDTKLCPSL